MFSIKINYHNKKLNIIQISTKYFIISDFSQYKKLQDPTVGVANVILNSCVYLSQWPRGLRYELSSLAGIVGSNPTQGMDVCACVYFEFVLFCV
jgi:hypothetical protein